MPALTRFPWLAAYLGVLAIYASMAELCAQSRQTLPAGLELIAGNDRALYPGINDRAQTWHWAYDNAEFQTRTAIAITALRLRPDEVASVWSRGSWSDVRVTLGRAATHYARAAYPSNFDAAFVPGSAQQVYRGDVIVEAGQHAGAGVAPFWITIPIDPPYRFDPTTGDDFVVELRLEASSSALFALDARSGASNSIGGNRYGQRTTSMATSWNFANDEFVPVIEIEFYPDQGPVPDFESSVQRGPSPLAVDFVEASLSSLPIQSIEWDFENDGTIDATGHAVAHSYTQSGLYDVRLRVSDGVNPARERIRQAWIDVDPAPRAAFRTSIARGAAPLTVQFTDQSEDAPTAWAWDFENDGILDSTQQNPTHTYMQSGIYAVRLVASNARGSTTRIEPGFVTVVAAASVPFADGFEGSTLASSYLIQAPTLAAEVQLGGTRAGCSPFAGQGFLSLATAPSVGFSRVAIDLVLDLSTHAHIGDLELALHGWNQGEEADPGDGIWISDDGVVFYPVLDLNSALQPARTWVEVILDLDVEIERRGLSFSSNFVVRLQREDDQSFAQGDGFAFDALSVGTAATRAAFQASLTQGNAPLSVQFVDRSTHAGATPIASWSWDFDGDGFIDSNAASPSFVYAFPGSYTVSLRVLDTLGRPSEVRAERLIRVGGIATIPFVDGFELGLLRPEWTIESSSIDGRIELSDVLGPTPWEGFWHVLLDRRQAGAPSTQRLTLHADLRGFNELELSYAIYGSNDENDPEDGCWISDDGQRWVLLQSHANLPAHWTYFVLDLGAAMRTAGLNFGPNVRVRFQQRDDFPLPADGICLDQVELRLPRGSVLRYGDGCVGALGTPAIFSTGGLPFAGNPIFRLHLAQAAANSPAILWIGLSNQFWPQAGLPLPLDLGLLGATGCQLLVAPEITLASGTSPAGSTSILLPIPFATGLPGLRAYAQWIVLDFLAPRPMLPAALSPGAIIRFGSY